MVGIFNASDSRYDTHRTQGTAVYNMLPDLTTMSLAAMNILNTSDEGFFVMLEGGGIDLAAHANSPLLPWEVNDFLSSVLAVHQWITDNDLWENTLLIVTADHETGDLWSKSGVGIVPASPTDYHAASGGHTNALVPLWAAGAGSDLFADYVYGKDTTAANKWNIVAGFSDWDGTYIDNINIFDVMLAAMNRIEEEIVILPETPSLVVTTLADHLTGVPYLH